MTEDEMVGWHHRLNGQEFEEALGNADGQGGLDGCSPWSHKESDTTERLNNHNRSHRVLHVALGCLDWVLWAMGSQACSQVAAQVWGS